MDDLFGSDDEADGGVQHVYIELMKVKSHVKKRIESPKDRWRRDMNISDSHVFDVPNDMLLSRRVAISSSCAEFTRLLQSKLSVSNFEIVHDIDNNTESDEQYDVLIINDIDVSSSKSLIKRNLVSGGLLFYINNYENINTLILDDNSGNDYTFESQWKCLQIIRDNTRFIHYLQLRCVDVNVNAAQSILQVDENLTHHSITYERELVDKVCIPLTYNERLNCIISDANSKRAVDSLNKYGIVILPGLYDKSKVLKWGATCIDDVQEAMNILKVKKNIDLLNLSPDQTIDNFHELSMREALRCDLRNGKRMKLFAKENSLRNHQGLSDILSEVMNPPGGNSARGNWGRWNFEGLGPDFPPPLNIGELGCVMNFNGCADQTIHADTSHLYVHTPTSLPPHYINIFCPAVDESKLSYAIGQTAFVVESHKLEMSTKIMVEENGNIELCKRIIRPHLKAGDCLLFDCRILHFGLANQCLSQDGTGGYRPLLYQNVWNSWFNDPKNWNDREKLFDEE